MLPEDPVTIVVVHTKARTTFRYWQLLIHQIITTVQAVLAFFMFNSNNLIDEQFLPVSLIICYTVLVGLAVTSMVLTYLYSTDTFILASCFFVTWHLHRQYPHQVLQLKYLTI